ncbi:hypothetical protein KSP40_PGU013605 [Platanthera guangdongensis]|uniref:Uncharacterized protein n=1 Tax=Platanthera guangdongensis TaxID=2320717 RepID=A0ABR2MIS9_9ASPA
MGSSLWNWNSKDPSMLFNLVVFVPIVSCAFQSCGTGIAVWQQQSFCIWPMRETKRSHGVGFVAILGGSAAEKKSH